MEINYEDLVERIFKKKPQNPKSITLDFVERLSLQELFEFLLSFFTDGTKILYGETSSNGTVQVDLNMWTQETVDEMKKYLAMIGFKLFVNIEDFVPNKDYPSMMFNKIEIKENTNLSELKMILRNLNKVYIISFEFLR